MNRSLIYSTLALSFFGLAYLPTRAPDDIADCVANRCAPAAINGSTIAWCFCLALAIGILAWLHTQDRGE